MPILVTTADFIKKAQSVHGNKYDYSESVYVSRRDQITVICLKHGKFSQQAGNHMNGYGCWECAKENFRNSYSKKKEQFIIDARKIHGDSYDYSKVEYVNNKTNVTIVCKKHGAFQQTPSNHSKSGCPKCSRYKNSISTEEFVRKAILVHGNKYDYSGLEYTGCKDKVKMICPVHGVFYNNPINHLNGHGCLKCGTETAMSKLRTSQDDFIKSAKSLHGDRYDYSKTIYSIGREKVIITCPIHGDFKQKANSHLNGFGCKKCGTKKAHENRRYKNEHFIDTSIRVHGDKYDYSETEYINSQTKVKIFCNSHNDYFYQSPLRHMVGYGCRKCSDKINSFIKQEWIDKFNGSIGTFYIIMCFNDTESFYKFGITSKPINKRYVKGKSMPYNYEVIRKIESYDLSYIWDLEKRFSKSKRKDWYVPKIPFKGSKHECFSHYTQKKPTE